MKNIEDKIACRAYRCLKSTRTTTQTLIDLNSGLARKEDTLISHTPNVHQRLKLLDQMIEGHINSVEILAERISATLGLVGQIVPTRGQY